MSVKDKDKKERKKKQQQSVLEQQIFAIMQASLKATIDQALDDIFKEWK